MIFLLQKEESKELSIDVRILKEELDKQKLTHKYEFLSKEQLSNYSEAYGCSLKNRIPVGTIEFVQTWLLRSCGIPTMNPIEIPKLMRTPRILKREYQIVDYDHLPREGIYFLKRVDKLKAFSYDGEVRHLFGVKVTPERGGSFAATYEEKNLLDKNGLYQVSERVPFLSEWRIFVKDWDILRCIHYDGKPDIFPDHSFLSYAVTKLHQAMGSHCPKAFTLDVGIIKDRGTALIEVHPWVSVGLYGYLFGSDLPYCYADGLDYYINHNIKIQE